MGVGYIMTLVFMGTVGNLTVFTFILQVVFYLS